MIDGLAHIFITLVAYNFLCKFTLIQELNIFLKSHLSEIIKLSSSLNDERRQLIADFLDKKLATIEVTVTKEHILSELELIMRLEDTHQMRIRNILKIFDLEQMFPEFTKLSCSVNDNRKQLMIDLLDTKLAGAEFAIDRKWITSQFELILSLEDTHRIQIRDKLKNLGLDQLFAPVIEFSRSMPDDKKRRIVNLLNEKLTPTQFNINKERILSELELIIRLEDVHQIQDKLKNLGIKICQIFTDALMEITREDR